MFVNRSDELHRMEELGRSGHAVLLALYGKPRMGKTELLRRYCRQMPHLYYAADFGSESDHLDQLRSRIREISNDREVGKCRTWEDMLEYVFRRLSRKAPLVILDEFPRLCSSRKNLAQMIIQKWRASDGSPPIYLCLCGSDVLFMEENVLTAARPEGNSSFSSIELGPLLFEDSKSFYPDASGRERAYIYAILGGCPAYLNQFNRNKTLEQNIKSEILNRDSFLFNEPRNLLFEILREPSTYFSILRAISFGKSRLREIAEEMGSHNIFMINKYLFRLRELKVIKRIQPAGEKNPEKSRKGRYELTDHFFRFWFRFIFPYRSFFEQGDKDYVWRRAVRPQLDAYVRPAFREICLQRIQRLNRYNKLPFEVAFAGPWWDQKYAIDIVAGDGNGRYIFCDCLWEDKKIGSHRLRGLIRRAREFPARAEKFYAFFSRAGYSVELKDMAKENPQILLLDYF